MAFMMLTRGQPAQTAGGAVSEVPIGGLPASLGETNYQVARISFETPAAIVGAATNNVTFSFNQYRGGAILKTLGSLTLDQTTNVTAFTDNQVPLVPAYPPALMLAGDVVTFVMTQNGTGVTVPAGIVAKIEVA